MSMLRRCRNISHSFSLSICNIYISLVFLSDKEIKGKSLQKFKWLLSCSATCIRTCIRRSEAVDFACSFHRNFLFKTPISNHQLIGIGKKKLNIMLWKFNWKKLNVFLVFAWARSIDLQNIGTVPFYCNRNDLKKSINRPNSSAHLIRFPISVKYTQTLFKFSKYNEGNSAMDTRNLVMRTE